MRFINGEENRTLYKTVNITSIYFIVFIDSGLSEKNGRCLLMYYYFYYFLRIKYAGIYHDML